MALTSQAPERVAIIMAAGRGVRMRSRLPKVLHEVGGQPALLHVIEAARSVGCARIFVIVGHGAARVSAAIAAPDIVCVEQRTPRGTGHAVLQAEAALGDWRGTALVLSGDAPLVRRETLASLARASESGWGAVAVARLVDPGSLGRVVSHDDRLVRIVEAADADAETLTSEDVNSGHYALPVPELFGYLHRLEPKNAQGELYLTDAVSAAAADRPVACVRLADATEALGLNDRRDLAIAQAALDHRAVAVAQAAGVTVVSPERVRIDTAVVIGEDTIIHPDVALLGRCRVGAGCVLHQGAWVRDSELGDGVEVLPYSVLDGARCAAGSVVGPYARLRPGAELGERARVGNFVEVKNAVLGSGVKANHLAYIGDAEIGAASNIGAGVVTCNYDGERKHQTRVGENAFIGSDTMLVAPVTVGDRASTGAGSVITDDVPEDSLALGRARQRNLVGWRRKKASEETGEP